MFASNPEWRNLPIPELPCFGIFVDYDETYKPTTKLIGPDDTGLRQLEKYLVNQSNQIVFGWISGSNLTSLFSKSEGYIQQLPHFISSSLGTELHWCIDGQILEDEEWMKQIRGSGFQRNKIMTLVSELELLHEIRLISQPDAFQGIYKAGYYYRSGEYDAEHFEIIHELANTIPADVKITKCNPAAGDPEGHFDVEFIPICCGKARVVEFISRRFKLDKSKTLAFGDSCNDVEMLGAVGHGYLVSNADEEARKIYPCVLSAPYCHGILEGARKHIAPMHATSDRENEIAEERDVADLC